ncbi:MAG TPA: hypothetical protein VN177_03945 [Myxococcales bacterium]|nr:hypothetical protein [Myxococcales bacterium]
MTLVRASESSSHAYFEMRRGNDEFVFVGAFRKGSITGSVHHAGQQLPFALYRTLEIDRHLLEAYAGAYGDSRSIEDCTDELGWQQLVYVGRSGGRKALFPESEDSFYFGPGYLIPGPIEGTITFLGATEGRARYLMVEQAGSEPEIARRSNSGAVRSRSLHGCSPLRASMKAGRSG